MLKDFFKKQGLDMKFECFKQRIDTNLLMLNLFYSFPFDFHANDGFFVQLVIAFLSTPSKGENVDLERSRAFVNSRLYKRIQIKIYGLYNKTCTIL